MNTIQLAATMENLDPSLDFLEEGFLQEGIDQKMAMKLRLACEEVIVNVIHYAYPGQEGTFQVSYRVDGGEELTIVVRDQGVPFDPLQREDPDISLSLDEREIGGLGIFMVRNIMDDLAYQREDGSNVLTMKKTVRK